MSTRKHSNQPAAPATPEAPAILDAVNDLPRQQMAMATQAACAMFRGFEAMRKTQEHAAHRALARHSTAADKLKAPCSPAQLLELQSELLRFDIESANLYWQQLHGAALSMQAEMLACGANSAAAESAQKAASALAFPAMAAAFGKGGFHGNARSESS